MTAKSGSSLACATWPLCNGELVPDLARWRDPDPLPAPRPRGRDRPHPAVPVLAQPARCRACPRASPARRPRRGAGRVQVGLGALVILLEVPVWQAVLHQAVGVLTFATITLLLWRCAAGRPAGDRCSETPMGWHYAALEERFRRIAGIDGALAILGWDTAVMMPRKSAADRGEQLAALKRLSHDLLTHPETGEQLAGAEEEADLDPWQQANLREMRRKYRHAHAVEPALVEALARATTTCEMTWREARAQSDFAMLAPQLTEVVRLVRETATVTGAALGLSRLRRPARRAPARPARRPGGAAVRPARSRAAAAWSRRSWPARRRLPAPLQPTGPFPAARQKELGKALMARLGFDFEAGRLDESAHPFCGGTPADIRITTRYREDEIVSALMGVLHETGHALYEAGLPRAWAGQPVGEAQGHRRPREPVAADRDAGLPLAGLHRLPRRRAAPHLRRRPGLRARQPAAHLRPGRARLHPGRGRRGDLPAARHPAPSPGAPADRGRPRRRRPAGAPGTTACASWSASSRPTTGWAACRTSTGRSRGFGYFPCYTLGAMLAAQLFNAAQAQVPGLLDAIGRGDFAPRAGLAAREGARPGCHAPLRRAGRAGLGRPARGRAVPGAPAGAISGPVRRAQLSGGSRVRSPRWGAIRLKSRSSRQQLQALHWRSTIAIRTSMDERGVTPTATQMTVVRSRPCGPASFRPDRSSARRRARLGGVSSRRIR